VSALNGKKLAIEFLTPSSLKPNSHNARTHSKHQIRQIAESIRVFGFNNPVLVDANNAIIAGHGRVEAARVLGMDWVPTIRLSAPPATRRIDLSLGSRQSVRQRGFPRGHREARHAGLDEPQGQLLG